MKEFVYQIAAGEADTILIADESGNIIYVDNPQKKIPLVLVWEGDKRVWVDNTDGSNTRNTLKYEDLLTYIKELESKLIADKVTSLDPRLDAVEFNQEKILEMIHSLSNRLIDIETKRILGKLKDEV